MQFTKNDKNVIEAFMNLKQIESFKCRTDGQSFFYKEVRLAEHVPNDDGTATTLVYDFTERGGAFLDKHSQWLVYQLRNSTPRQNTVPVPLAQKVGLVPFSITNN